MLPILQGALEKRQNEDPDLIERNPFSKQPAFGALIQNTLELA